MSPAWQNVNGSPKDRAPACPLPEGVPADAVSFLRRDAKELYQYAVQYACNFG